MKKPICVAILLFSLCGCAKEYWAHPYKSTQQFYRDSARCEAMSYSPGNGQIMPGNSSFANTWNQLAAMDSNAANGRIYNYCMMGEGWYLTTSDSQRRTSTWQQPPAATHQNTKPQNNNTSKSSNTGTDKTWANFIKSNPVFADTNSKQRQYGDYLFNTIYNQQIENGEISYQEALNKVAKEVYSSYPASKTEK